MEESTKRISIDCKLHSFKNFCAFCRKTPPTENFAFEFLLQNFLLKNGLVYECHVKKPRAICHNIMASQKLLAFRKMRSRQHMLYTDKVGKYETRQVQATLPFGWDIVTTPPGYQTSGSSTGQNIVSARFLPQNAHNPTVEATRYRFRRKHLAEQETSETSLKCVTVAHILL